MTRNMEISFGPEMYGLLETFWSLKVRSSSEPVIPLSLFRKNVIGLKTASASQNSSAQVARRFGLQTDAVVLTETCFSLDP